MVGWTRQCCGGYAKRRCSRHVQYGDYRTSITDQMDYFQRDYRSREVKARLVWIIVKRILWKRFRAPPKASVLWRCVFSVVVALCRPVGFSATDWTARTRPMFIYKEVYPYVLNS